MSSAVRKVARASRPWDWKIDKRSATTPATPQPESLTAAELTLDFPLWLLLGA